jgi:beta-mannanase
MVSMFWSPNNLGGDSAETLDEWYPGDDIVDIVGTDCYPQARNQTFRWCYKEFYDRFLTGKDKLFAIGETGASGDLKEHWLRELVTQRKEEYPNYVSMAWFEYNKEVDFRLVMGNRSTLEDRRKILELE